MGHNREINRYHSVTEARWLRWDKRHRKVCAYIAKLEDMNAPGMEEWVEHTLEYQYAIRDGLILNEPPRQGTIK